MKSPKTIHFISGMPRSGSTLLCNILAQNPRFHSTHTSGLLDVLFSIRNQWDQLVEHRAHPLPDTKMRVLRAAFYAYHEDHGRPVVFDKSRGWVAHLELLEEILGRPAKVLVPVRSLVDILASFEKLHRTAARTRQPPGEAQNYFKFQTVAGRCEHWAGGDQVVGIAFSRVKDAVQRGFRDRLHCVHFDRLVSSPGETMRDIYQFLGEEPFAHDFDHVRQVTEEDDETHGYPNLHTIRPKVVPVPSASREILGQELWSQYGRIELPV